MYLDAVFEARVRLSGWKDGTSGTSRIARADLDRGRDGGGSKRAVLHGRPHSRARGGFGSGGGEREDWNRDSRREPDFVKGRTET